MVNDLTSQTEPAGRVPEARVVAYAQDAVRDGDGKHMVVFVEENEPGYWPSEITRGSLEEAQAAADAINVAEGYSPETVQEVIGSSFAAQAADSACGQ